MNVVKLYISEGSNPREDENLSTIAAKNFNADERIGDPIDWLADKLNYTETYVERIAHSLGDSYYSNKVREELEERFLRKFIALPVYKYEHGNISLSTTPFSCRWDSGQLGYIYATRKEVRSSFNTAKISNKLKEQVLDIFRSELEIFERYVKGEIYGFSVEDTDGNVLDSCGGFYGDDWDSNGILDNLNYVEYDLASTRAEMLEILIETKIDY